MLKPFKAIFHWTSLNSSLQTNRDFLFSLDDFFRFFFLI